MEVLTANPGLMIVLALLAGGTVVCALLAVPMWRAGVSLKPIVFFGGFFAIVVLPQFVGHLALAVKPGAAAAAPAAAAAQPLPGGVQQDWLPIYAPRLPGLASAEGTQWPTGQSLVTLRFGSAEQAQQGLTGYLTLHQVAPTLDRGGNEVRGTRGLGGGVVHLLREGAAVHVSVALSDAALDALTAPASEAAPAPTAEPLVPALQAAARLFRQHVLLQVAAVLALVLTASLWFFRASAWAASTAALPTATPLSATLLRERLLALHQSSFPVKVSSEPDGGIAVTWDLADLRWLDFMGLKRLRRSHRLLLRLDESRRAVLVTEQWTVFEASAGTDAARLRWHTARGISFFQVEHERTFGVMLGPDGKPTGELSHRFRFNLQELKAPFITAATHAGWAWRPVVIDGAAFFSSARRHAPGRAGA